MNPFKAIGSMQNFINIASQARQLQANPSQIGQVLFNSGKIDQNTFDAIKNMGSPAQIGNYLLSNGILGQQQVNQLSQMVPQVQQFMK